MRKLLYAAALSAATVCGGILAITGAQAAGVGAGAPIAGAAKTVKVAQHVRHRHVWVRHHNRHHYRHHR
jgi:hypothetical protein